MTKEFDLLHVRIVGFIGEHTFRDSLAIATELRRQLESMQAPGQRLLAVSPLTGPADLLFAKEVLGLAIPLVVALTMPREELRKNFSDGDAAEFDHVLQQAARVEVLLLSPHPDATTRLGQKLVDEADVIMAIRDAARPDDPAVSATREVLAYATRRGRSLLVLEESGDGIAVREIKAKPDSPDEQLSIEELEKMLGPAPAKLVIPEAVLRYFHACDLHATQTAPQVRRYLMNIFLANATAALAGGVSGSYTYAGFLGTALTVIKFLCIGTGLIILIELRKRQSRNRWLDLRLKAEVCRSAIATWNSPVPIEAITADEVPELRHLLQALRYFHATRHPAPDITLDEFKASYGHRLIDQYRYFRQQAESVVFLSKLTPLCYFLSGLALVISLASLIVGATYGHYHPLGRWTNFVFIIVPIIAPLLASFILTWQTIEAVSRKRARFVEMQRASHQALVDLVHCHSWETVQYAAKKAERHLLSEVLEWYSFVKFS